MKELKDIEKSKNIKVLFAIESGSRLWRMESKDSDISAMIALEVDDEVLVQRLLERGKTSGRPDDADEGVIRNRIKVYYNVKV